MSFTQDGPERKEDSVDVRTLEHETNDADSTRTALDVQTNDDGNLLIDLIADAERANIIVDPHVNMTAGKDMNSNPNEVEELAGDDDLDTWLDSVI